VARLKFYFIACLVALNGLFLGYAWGLNSRHVLIVDPKLPRYVKPAPLPKVTTGGPAGTKTEPKSADGKDGTAKDKPTTHASKDKSATHASDKSATHTSKDKSATLATSDKSTTHTSKDKSVTHATNDKNGAHASTDKSAPDATTSSKDNGTGQPAIK
jgi:hypothetical protein